jgi:hypothetical protein
VAKVVDRRLLLLPAAALVVAVVLGYVAGRGHARALPREQTFTISVGSILLDLPARWHRVSAAPAVPGLAMKRVVALAPGGDPSGAALLAGALPARQASPLPRAFVSRMQKLPTTTVVSLPETQAYRYTDIVIPGLAQSLTIYVVPNSGGDPTALICSANPTHTTDMQACERAIATLTLAGQTQSYDLTPQPEYAQNLSALLTSLDMKRVTLRRGLAGHPSPAGAQHAAVALARAFALAASSLSSLEPTVSGGPAQSALSGALLRARGAYAALAAAAAARSEAQFASARMAVDEAESVVDEALANFALLGYKPA